MENKSCSVIEDLIPLYVDGVCSEESKKYVEEHIATCEKCKELVEQFKENITISEEHDQSVLKKIKRRLMIERFVSGFIVFIIAVNILFYGFFFLIDDVPVNDCIQKEDIQVEERANGDVYMIRSGVATKAMMTFKNQCTEDGEVLAGMKDGKPILLDIKKGEPIVIKPEIYTTRFDKLCRYFMGSQEEEVLLFNKNEKENFMKVIMEYEEGEVLLWER